MARLTERKLVLVTRKTRLEELVEKYNTVAQAQFYLEHAGIDVNEYLHEHDQYQRAVTQVEHHLTQLGRVQRLDRQYLSNFLFGEEDIVVVVGQDGLVANTLKYLSGQHTVAINPDPQKYEGVLLPFGIEDASVITREVLEGRRSSKSITMAEARTNDGQRMLAVNDLFIGPKFHTSARYYLAQGEVREFQSSSGIIVSTGLGSTGWMRSILTGALGVATAMGGRSSEGASNANFAWDADYLQFAVREPFPSTDSFATLIFGQVSQNNPLSIESSMPQDGVVFSDGIVDDAIAFNSGSLLDVRPSLNAGQLIV